MGFDFIIWSYSRAEKVKGEGGYEHHWESKARKKQKQNENFEKIWENKSKENRQKSRGHQHRKSVEIPKETKTRIGKNHKKHDKRAKKSVKKPLAIETVPDCTPKKSGKNEEFKCAGTECQLTCANLHQPCCFKHKRAPQACFCNEGFARDKCNECIEICSIQCQQEVLESCDVCNATCIGCSEASNDTNLLNCHVC